jgi:hypothetical protein
MASFRPPKQRSPGQGTIVVDRSVDHSPPHSHFLHCNPASFLSRRTSPSESKGKVDLSLQVGAPPSESLNAPAELPEDQLAQAVLHSLVVETTRRIDQNLLVNMHFAVFSEGKQAWPILGETIQFALLHL